MTDPAAIDSTDGGDRPSPGVDAVRSSHPVLRGLLHLAVAWHVVAIAVGPASVPPSSGIERSAWRVVGPYLQALFLNHGYHFFAPDPGDSTLIEFVATREDGTRIEGRMPSLRDSRPRLLYHRDFMLTESLPRMLDGPSADRDAYLQAMADGLGRRHSAQKVSLTQVTRALPTPMAVRAGFPADDPGQITRRTLGTFSCRR